MPSLLSFFFFGHVRFHPIFLLFFLLFWQARPRPVVPLFLYIAQPGRALFIWFFGKLGRAQLCHPFFCSVKLLCGNNPNSHVAPLYLVRIIKIYCNHSCQFFFNPSWPLDVIFHDCWMWFRGLYMWVMRVLFSPHFPSLSPSLVKVLSSYCGASPATSFRQFYHFLRWEISLLSITLLYIWLLSSPFF